MCNRKNFSEEQSFRIRKKDFIEFEDRELKDREVKNKKEIEELFLKTITVSINDMDKSEGKENKGN